MWWCVWSGNCMVSRFFSHHITSNVVLFAICKYGIHKFDVLSSFSKKMCWARCIHNYVGLGSARNCGFAPGIHLVKLPKLKRQFAFVVPRGRVESSRGAPVFMFFHGVYQTPWFSINILGLPDMLERYGWFGILPFGDWVMIWISSIFIYFPDCSSLIWDDDINNM